MLQSHGRRTGVIEKDIKKSFFITVNHSLSMVGLVENYFRKSLLFNYKEFYIANLALNRDKTFGNLFIQSIT